MININRVTIVKYEDLKPFNQVQANELWVV